MTNLRFLSSFADKRSPLSYLLPGIHQGEIVYRKSTASGNFPFSKFCLSERSFMHSNPPPIIFWNPNISPERKARIPVYQRHQDACETDLHFSTRELLASVARIEPRKAGKRRNNILSHHFVIRYRYGKNHFIDQV